MQTSVLLSIKPKFAEAIFEGTKKYEFRRAVYRNSNIERIFVYATSPVCKVIGEFMVAEILNMTVWNLWQNTSRGAGINENYFREYFRGRTKGYALRVAKPRKYTTPLSLKEYFGITHPPQSFRYISRNLPKIKSA